MPYNIFLTVRRPNEFTKAKAVYVGAAGESEHVLTIEDSELVPALECVTELLKAISSHMAVRREAARRDT